MFLSLAQAASLNQLYGYLLEKDDFLLMQGADYYQLLEDSHHASPLYDKFNSKIEIVFLDTSFKFSPLKDTEILFGVRQAYPVDYSRSTYRPDDTLGVMLNYELENFRDFSFQLRRRQGPFEPYLSVSEKRQKTNWNSSDLNLSPLPNYFAYIRTHYEDLSLGLRYLSDSKSKERQESNFSLLRRPLLTAKQLNLDARFRYRSARLRRNVDIYPAPGFIYLAEYYQRLESQYTPGVRLGYGLNDTLELTSGLEFSLPYKYRFFYRVDAATVTMIKGIYTLREEVNMPLQLRYRPLRNFEILFSSDFSYSNQKLDYWRSAAGATTNFADKKLNYFNVKPSLALAYLFENDNAIVQDRFSYLTKRLLSQGQCLLQFKYLRDITSLDKNAANGPQNKIDPYGIFLYPIDLFMAGTENATFFTGNKSDTAANVALQNYNLFQLSFMYGLTERLNAGLNVGYRSSSRFHHFTLGSSSSFDLKSRYYVIKPYWFFSVPCEWRLNENSLFSLVWYYVPEYRTDIEVEGVAKKFRSKTNHYSISFALKVLF
jgi:hypothetical protein